MCARILFVAALVLQVGAWRQAQSDITLRQLFADIWEGRCLPGESWMENCASCHCDGTGHAVCKSSPPTCDQRCHYPSTWFTDQQRCRCTSSTGGIICVESAYQPGMNKQPCTTPGAHLIGQCTRCECTHEKLTSCDASMCDHLARGTTTDPLATVCTPGEVTTRGCRRCHCTATMFQVCFPLTDCLEDKPGHCPAGTDGWGSVSFEVLWCVMRINQMCYSDSECPRDQKCCRTECYFICTDSIK